MIGGVYRAEAEKLTNKDRAAYKVFYKGKELKGVVAVEYIVEMNL